MGDYIEINTDEGIKKAELVSKFELNGLGQYIIYKLDNKLYGARYEIKNGETILITDLTTREKEMLNEMFLQLEVE